MVDETKKAASVAQLQELHARLPEMIENVVKPIVTAAIEGAISAMGPRFSGIETSVADTRKAMPQPVDLTPVLAALAEQSAAIHALATAIAERPVAGEREGTAELPNGDVIKLKVGRSN